MKYYHPTQIPRSSYFRSLEWIGERIVCADVNVRGDTYPQTWSDDDELYTGVGDPNCILVDGKLQSTIDFSQEEKDKYWQKWTGLVVDKISGAGNQFDIVRVNEMPGFLGGGGHGPKPCGMISVDGNLYLAAQNLLGWKPPRHGQNSQHGSDATIIKSTDKGMTWTPDLDEMLIAMEKEQHVRSTWTWTTPPEQRGTYKDWTPMFPGNLFGGPSFIQYGRNNEAALDDYVYAVSGDHWDNGTEMRLGRVTKDRILDAKSWEFAVVDDNTSEVSWTNDLYKSVPVLSIDRHLSLPEMVYLSSAKKYLLATWALHTDYHANDGSELTILESENPWGPFSLVHYEWMWYKEEAGLYCPRIPLKWFDEQAMTGYMLASGNWITVTQYYLPQTMQFKLNMNT